jgi:glycosyltransferase involved in cell wall biosynthesis
MTIEAPQLSIVVPAYDEQERIRDSLRRLGYFLVSQGYKTELIVVDDGSKPAGRKAAEEALNELPPEISRTFIQHEVNRGKGAAVRTGCLAATGSYVAFIDADLASPPEDLLVLLTALDAGADLAVGIRNQGDGSDMRDKRGIARRLAGRFFAFSMRTLLLPDIGDSQCPLKAFKRSSAQRLFRLQRVDTWSFDAELLFLADRLGLRVAKAPVSWHAVDGSHLKLNAKSAMEVWNLFRIRWQHRGVNAMTLAEAPELA